MSQATRTGNLSRERERRRRKYIYMKTCIRMCLGQHREQGRKKGGGKSSPAFGIRRRATSSDQYTSVAKSQPPFFSPHPIFFCSALVITITTSTLSLSSPYFTLLQIVCFFFLSSAFRVCFRWRIATDKRAFNTQYITLHSACLSFLSFPTLVRLRYQALKNIPLHRPSQ